VRDNESLSCEIPAAAFYLMIKAEQLDGRTDERFVLDLLKETGVLVVPGSGSEWILTWVFSDGLSG